jgi:molybdopterin-guanine dinucleotide biosynthesis protein A
MLSIVVQAGGGSTRMGQDKALMNFLGRPLIKRVIERLSPIADEVLVTTNHPEAYAFLGLPLFQDLKPDRGALGGLYTALASAKEPLIAVVACDMPFVSRELIGYQRDLLLAEKADVVIPSTRDGLEPFHTVYRRETCLAAVAAVIDDDRWKVISWLPQVKVRTLSPDEIARFDPDGLAFWNLNTPEEFVDAEQRARAIEKDRPL